MKLPDSYSHEYDLMLEFLATLFAKRPRPVSGFWPRIGSAYKPGGLMIVARTVNGWRSGAQTADLVNKPLRDEIINDRKADAEDPSRDPMSWVVNSGRTPDPRETPFWQFAKAAAMRLDPTLTEENWWSAITWTSLAKVGFADGGNPTEALWYHQQQHCKKLFEIEVETLKPGTVLIVADDKSVRDFRTIESVEWTHLDHEENIQLLGEGPNQRWMMIQKLEGQELGPLLDLTWKRMHKEMED